MKIWGPFDSDSILFGWKENIFSHYLLDHGDNGSKVLLFIYGKKIKVD
jgi:hypothetical protein